MRIGALLPRPLKNFIVDRSLYRWYRAVRATVDLSSPHRFYESIGMLAAFMKVRKYTLLDFIRLKTLYDLSRKIDDARIQGDIVECGQLPVEEFIRRIRRAL